MFRGEHGGDFAIWTRTRPHPAMGRRCFPSPLPCAKVFAMVFDGSKKKVHTEEELYEYAVGALARRMRSVAELKRLLREKVEAETEFGQTLVELIIRKLKD